MESVDTTACLIDNLLDFASDVGEEDIDDEHGKPLPSTTSSLPFDVLEKDDTARLLPEVAEEELEWISNKDAFPTVETIVDILSDQHQDALRKHSSPVSVLDNSTASSSGGRVSRFIIASYRGSFQVPVKARSRSHSRRRRDVQEDRWWWCRRQEHVKSAKAAAGMTASTMGKKCQHCGAEKTPQWRAGPLGPKTLCNACGVRYKSGRLVPEYRPASSPSFCGELHSNSHRKVLEMRKRKQMMGLLIEKPMDKA